MQLRTTHHEVAGHSVLALEGTADLAALPQLHAACQRLLTGVRAGAALAIDVDGVTVLDDAALGLLLGAAATARSGGAVLRVVCTGERLRRRLADTRFDRAVDVVGSLGDTVADRSPEVS
ncbi:MAG: STAS domain-containing protein [Ilumatobacteraceae bacterium]|nr:STAS domain-containing protein [Ilumatobacteraceae bacterium]